jgi:hypothetical protein
MIRSRLVELELERTENKSVRSRELHISSSTGKESSVPRHPRHLALYSILLERRANHGRPESSYVHPLDTPQRSVYIPVKTKGAPLKSVADFFCILDHVVGVTATDGYQLQKLDDECWPVLSRTIAPRKYCSWELPIGKFP